MTPDSLDDLLERSAPATRGPRDADVAAMIADARAEAPTPRRVRRARRVGLTAGVLAAVFVGGAGVAAATDGFTWLPWAQDPVGAVQFTMGNGFACELRYSEYTGGADPSFASEVNRVLENWYRTADVVAQAEAILPQKRTEFAATHTESAMEPDAGGVELTPEQQEAELAHRAWVAEWSAWSLALDDLETQALRDAGLVVPDERLTGAERSGQLQCTVPDGELYVPGAGS